MHRKGKLAVGDAVWYLLRVRNWAEYGLQTIVGNPELAFTAVLIWSNPETHSTDTHPQIINLQVTPIKP